MSLQETVKRWIKFAVAVLVYYSGGLALFRRWRASMRGHQLRLLAYHGIADAPRYLSMCVPVQHFARQMRFIGSHYHAVSMKEVERLLDSGHPPQHDTVIVTLDDGYRDNYTHAFPIAAEHGIPITVYLATGYIDSGKPTFIHALMLAIDASRTETLDLTDPGLGVFDLTSPAAREHALRQIDAYAKTLAFDPQRALLGSILERLGTDARSVLCDRMLTWDQIREMRNGGACFGGHTVSHPVLSRLDAAAAEREIRECRERIAAELGEAATTFAYPYGGKDAISDSVVALVSAIGYRSAVTLYPSRPNAAARYALGRMMVSEEMSSNPWGRHSDAVFACELSGFFESLLGRA